MFYDNKILLENQYYDEKNKLYFKIWSKDDGAVPHIHISSDPIPSTKTDFKCCICLTDNVSYPHGIFTDKITEDKCKDINTFFKSKTSKKDKNKMQKNYGIECNTMYDVFRVLWNIGNRTQFISYNLNTPTYNKDIKPYQNCNKDFHLNTVNKSELKDELKNKGEV